MLVKPIDFYFSAFAATLALVVAYFCFRKPLSIQRVMLKMSFDKVTRRMVSSNGYLMFLKIEGAIASFVALGVLVEYIKWIFKLGSYQHR